MESVWGSLKAAFAALTWVTPLVSVYPVWAKVVFASTGAMVAVSLAVFAVNVPSAKRKLDPTGRRRMEDLPYEGFDTAFRSIVAPHRLPTGSILHLVRGDAGSVRDMTVVLPVSESFDFNQRGSKSVLAAFDAHTIDGKPFYQYLDERWPPDRRPNRAGPGTAQFVRFSNESQALAGVIFVVTTQNKGAHESDYGRYRNTPLASIDLILTKVLEKAGEEGIESIALPLLGAGYANIQLTHGAPELRALLERAVFLLSVDKLLKILADPAPQELRRAVVVVYAADLDAPPKDHLLEVASTFLTQTPAQRERSIRAILEDFSRREAAFAR